MVHITRFRAILAGADGDHTKDRNAPGSRDEISGKVLEIFDTLECFDLDKWAKGVTTPYDTTELPAVGRVFALAIRLYCILTLPSLADALAGSSAASGHSRYPDLCAYDGLRIQYREQLIVQLRDIWDRIEYQGGIAWPLVVAGVAATDSVEQDRDFIDQCMWEIWNKPSAGATFIIALEKLRIFWRSGKSGWEDCFDEPTPCYA
ncbi:hypothetical protein PWT90_02475 [Aphanocladium album]|nr:hypothetical protein PWT90_02475 [Aphanocladium album]